MGLRSPCQFDHFQAFEKCDIESGGVIWFHATGESCNGSAPIEARCIYRLRICCSLITEVSMNKRVSSTTSKRLRNMIPEAVA